MLSPPLVSSLRPVSREVNPTIERRASVPEFAIEPKANRYEDRAEAPIQDVIGGLLYDQ